MGEAGIFSPPILPGVGNLPLLFDEGAELLFQILAARYEMLSTVITTYLPFSEWIKVFHDKMQYSKRPPSTLTDPKTLILKRFGS